MFYYIELINEKTNKKDIESNECILDKLRADFDKHYMNNHIQMLLKSWGSWSKTNQIGYKPLAMYQHLNVTDKQKILFLEKEIIMIDTLLLLLKNSKKKEHIQMYEITQMYYCGIDIFIDNRIVTKRMNIRNIARILKMSTTTIQKRLKTVEGYLINELYDFL